MYYHRRYLEDGSCEVICVRCFQTLGTAEGIAATRHLEAAHVCKVLAFPNAPCRDRSENASHLVPTIKGGQLSSYSKQILGLPVPLLLLVAPLLLYGLPTALEFLLQHFTGPWLAGILLGDLTACICLYAVFGMRRTGMVLYLVLAITKICLFAAQAIPANVLLWMVDSIPALLVLVKIARMRTGHALRIAH